MKIDSKPILFLLGPSGAGKSQLAAWMAEDLQCLHFEIDRWPEGDGIDLSGLRPEWDLFWRTGQAAGLATAIRERVEAEGREGGILSFASTLVLPVEWMKAAEGHGIRSVILYGTGAECLAAFMKRENESGRGLDAGHWIHHNAQSHAAFSRPEYSVYRLGMFKNGDRRSRTELVTEMKGRLGQKKP